MKWFLVVAALALCSAASATAATPAAVSAPRQVNVSQRTCSEVPAAYRTSVKGAVWAASCMVCKRLGPRQMARAAHISPNDPPYVARKYAEKYVQALASRGIVARLGGAAAARNIVRNGCYTGFQARGRP